jgi:hypothetical protein
MDEDDLVTDDDDNNDDGDDVEVSHFSYLSRKPRGFLCRAPVRYVARSLDRHLFLKPQFVPHREQVFLQYKKPLREYA